MAKLSVLAGATSQTFNIFVQDSSSTVGAGLKGLIYSTSSLQCGFTFAKGFPVSITLASLATATVAYLSGGFVELSQSIMPGWYRFDAPNSILAAGNGRYSNLHFFGAANMAPLPVEIELTAWDNQNSISGGMGALPGSIAGAVGGLPVLDANSLVDVNVQRWLASAVSMNVAGQPIVDMTYVRGSISPASVGYVAMDWSKTGSVAASQFFSGTTIAQVNTHLNNINANVTSIAGVAVNAASAQLGVNLVSWLAVGPNALVTGKVDVLNRTTSGTAQGGNASSITLPIGSSTVNNFYNWQYAQILAGTGAGQARLITGYSGTTSVANVSPNWATSPDSTSTIALFPQGNVDTRAYGGNVVAASNVPGVPVVDMTYVQGSISPASVGYVAVDWSKTGSIAALVTFSNTTIGGMIQSSSATVSGNVNANVISIAGVAVNTSVAQLGVNVVQWGSVAVVAPSVNGVPVVDTTYIRGSISPASVGYVAPDWSKVGSVAAVQIFSGTTIAGMQQAVSATVSGAVSANVVQWNSGNVPATSVTGVPVVDARYYGGSIGLASAAYVAVDWSKTGSVAAAQFFSGTTIAQINAVLNNVNANLTSISGIANPASAGYVAMDWSKTGSVAAAQFFSGTTLASVLGPMAVFGGVTVASYQSGQDPATQFLGASIENGISMQLAMRYAGAAAAGKLAGASTSAVTISGMNNSVTRISATVDTVGNRLSITLS